MTLEEAYAAINRDTMPPLSGFMIVVANLTVARKARPAVRWLG